MSFAAQVAGSSQCADEELDEAHSSLNPAEFLKMKPKKSILKTKQASFDDLNQAVLEQRERDLRGVSEGHGVEETQKAHFDEMNILATHHPQDKDYGHMKIDEPKTPYTAGYSDSEGEELSAGGTTRPRRVSLVKAAVDSDELCKGIKEGLKAKPKVLEPGSGEDDEEDESTLTQEELAHKRDFEKKRKQHYNEGLYLRKLKEEAAAKQAEEEKEEGEG